MNERDYKNTFLDKVNIYIPQFSEILDVLDVNLYNVFGTYDKYSIDSDHRAEGLVVRYANEEKRNTYSVFSMKENMLPITPIYKE